MINEKDKRMEKNKEKETEQRNTIKEETEKEIGKQAEKQIEATNHWLRSHEILDELFGPEEYEDPEGYDEKEAFQKIAAKRAALKKEKRRTYIKSVGTFAKAAVLVLVAGLCVAGLSLKSEATRMWWMESFGWSIGDDSSTKVNNDSEREVSNAPEWEAADVIEQELGMKVPKLLYKPDRCVFSDYRYEAGFNSVVLYYAIEEEYLTISIISGDQNATSSSNFDGILLAETQLETSYADVLVREIRGEDNQKATVVAEWDYQDVHYEIFGRIPLEEMVAIVQNLYL